MISFEEQRAEMVATQIKQRGLHNRRLLDAFQTIPRHEFVPATFRGMAYEDTPLAIGNGQTISQPYIVALMTSLLNLQGTECVLEVGTGSGYQAAVLAQLAKTVHTIERFETLAHQAHHTLVSQKILNVHVHIADGTLGWPSAAPYQGILVTAAAPAPPSPLLEQLDEEGRLVLPVGGRSGQMLQVWVRKGFRYEHEDIIPVAFVPLRGTFGWDEGEWD